MAVVAADREVLAAVGGAGGREREEREREKVRGKSQKRRWWETPLSQPQFLRHGSRLLASLKPQSNGNLLLVQRNGWRWR